jgi:hypothetical protein
MTKFLASFAVLLGLGIGTCLQAEGIEQKPESTSGRAGQDDVVRRRSAVDALGRWVVEHYADRRSIDSGILDVTKSPYLADSTGRKDSTRAIQQAMKDARDARLVTFLPSGTYRVSDTISCIQGVVPQDHLPFEERFALTPTTTGASGFRFVSDYYPCVLMGSRQGQRSTIVLAPGSVGFRDPQRPKPLIHIWARTEDPTPNWWALQEGAVPPDPKQPDPNEPLPEISYNNLVVDIDLVLTRGNSGAVGIDLQAAQGSAIEDVTINATGAFAGIHKAPGSGGGIHGLTVVGGRYGMYLKNDPPASLESGAFLWTGTQTVPVVSNATLKGQTERAILYAGRGPLTVVGGVIEGAGIEAQGEQPWNGAMNFVDTVFRPRKGICAIVSNHSVYLYNVYLEHSKTIACVEGHRELSPQPRHWTHVDEYAAATTLQYPPWLEGVVRRDGVYRDGQPVSESDQIGQMDSSAPPTDLRRRHIWSPLPSWDDQGAANVRAAPYGAKGDGKSDDTAAIQRAIDEHAAVFLPKGEYMISRPLLLSSRTRLFGVGNTLSVVSALASPAFTDLEHSVPLIDTVDDAQASTELAFVELRLPVSQPSVYALRWRAGRHSVVRNIRPVATLEYPLSPLALNAMIQIEGSGGGRWYDLYQVGGWFNGPNYRHLLVKGTREPLSFYMLNPEFARSSVQVEFNDARNISIYSLKTEGMYSTLWMRNCRNVRLFGYGGAHDPQLGYSAFQIDDSYDFALTNLDSDLTLYSEMHVTEPNPWNMPVDPRKWSLLTHTTEGAQTTTPILGIQQVLLYKYGNPKSVY